MSPNILNAAHEVHGRRFALITKNVSRVRSRLDRLHTPVNRAETALQYTGELAADLFMVCSVSATTRNLII